MADWIDEEIGGWDPQASSGNGGWGCGCTLVVLGIIVLVVVLSFILPAFGIHFNVFMWLEDVLFA